IGEFQLIGAKLADMATELHAARLTTYDAAARLDAGDEVTTVAAMAKYFTTEVCARIVDEAMRVFGSYGYAVEYPVQRYFRDASFLLYGGGTSEILKGLIGRDVLKRGGWGPTRSVGSASGTSPGCWRARSQTRALPTMAPQ